MDGRLGYPGALGRVLLNLTTNALKYTNEGSVTIGVTELGETRRRVGAAGERRADQERAVPQPATDQ